MRKVQQAVIMMRIYVPNILIIPGFKGQLSSSLTTTISDHLLIFFYCKVMDKN